MGTRRARATTARSGRLRTRRALAAVTAAGVLLTACTDEDEPDDRPPPAATEEPAPAGLQVAVVLSVVDGGTDTVPTADLRERLDGFAEDRRPEVASVRVAVVDESDVAADVGALLAGDGHDLVCLLGDVTGGVVLDLAERFPDTRFCAIGTEVDDLPANVQLIEVAQEELGFALGRTAAALAGDRPVVLLSADDRTDRRRRRDGIALALDPDRPVLVPLPRTAEAELDADALARRLEEVAADGPVGAYVLDAPPPLVDAALATLPDRTVVAPARGTAGRPEVVVRYRIDVAAIVARALDRLVDGEPADLGEVGFARGAFDVLVAGDPPELAPAFEAARERLVAGLIDLDVPPQAPAEAEPGESSEPTPEADADGAPE